MMVRWRSWLAMVAIGLAGACGVSEGPENPLRDGPNAGAGNRPPIVASFGADPTTLSKGGTALVSAVATDPDGDGVVFAFSADHGKLVPDPTILGRATYTHDASETTADTIKVAVTDSKGATSQSSCGVTIVLPPKYVCGDGVCNGGETGDSCCTDCGCGAGTRCEANACVSFCGNGSCDVGENCQTCNGDCGCPGGQTCYGGYCIAVPYCGDGVCYAGEDYLSCCKDCAPPGGSRCW